MKRLVLTVIFFILILAPLSCGVEIDEIGSGCLGDDDCSDERVCVDHVCRFAADAELIWPAEYTALVIFQALKEQTAAHFDMALPLLEDYGWGFDLSGDGLYNEQQLAFMNGHRDAQYADYEKLLEDFDFSTAVYSGFSPGSYQPIPQGEQRAARNLDCLLNSQITFEVDGKKEKLLIGRMVRLRNRWCLFNLTL